MAFPSPGEMTGIAEFREHWCARAPDLDCDPASEGHRGPLGWPIDVHGRRLTNRFAVHPMEGWDANPDGSPGELTLRRWRRFGRSGAALLWGGEAYAVHPDGRANPRQLGFDPAADPAAGLAALLDAFRAGRAETGFATEPCLTGLQLTHSGRWSQPSPAGRAPGLAHHHPLLDPRVGVGLDHPLLTDGELEAIGERFVATARLAWRAGFDFVDVKCCHGYLLHELLGARTRPGPYGGSFENRTRLVGRILAAIRSECPGLGLGVRLSIFDSIPFEPDPATGIGRPAAWDPSRPYDHGFGIDRDDPRRPDLDEPLRFLAQLAPLGVGLVNVTAGSPYYCPHVQRPAAYPPSDGYLPPEDPLLAVAALLRATRRAKAAHPGLLLVGTGYTYLQGFLPLVAQHEIRGGHVDFAGLGRMILSYPELPADVLAGRPLDRRRICRTFSDCTSGPRQGLVSGCYPLDPQYRDRPEAAALRALRQRRR